MTALPGMFSGLKHGQSTKSLVETVGGMVVEYGLSLEEIVRSL
jgi:hypothetical protein